MNINSMAFVAPNLVCGEAQGGSIPQRWGCDRRATKPQAKFGATRRAAGLFRPDFVARSLQIHGGICASLAPRLSEKSLAANVIGFMFMTTKASTYQMYHSETFDNPLSHSMFQNPLFAPRPVEWTDLTSPAAPPIFNPRQKSGPTPRRGFRACLETTRGAAARDFGCGQGGEFRASPQRAVRNEPTPATDKRPAARRVFAEKAVWLRCSSVEDPPGIFSFVAPRHPAFSPKTAPLVVAKQALREMRERFPAGWKAFAGFEWYK